MRNKSFTFNNFNQVIPDRICKRLFVTGISLFIALMFLPVGTTLGDEEDVQEAGLIDLSFQRDMQYAMNKIMANIHGSSSPEFELNEGQVADLLNFQSEQLLAQNETTESQLAEIENTNTESTSSSVEASDDGDVVTLNFQGADINALINLVSQVTNKSFIVDPRVRGKVTLVSGGGLPVDQLYEIFLSVLEVSNFAAVEAGSITKILPKNLIKQHPTPTSDSGVPNKTDEHFTHIITLEHASVSELLPILRPLLPPTAHIAPHVGSNTLILTGTGANINRAVNLIKRMDMEQRGIDIQVIYLKHADATKLAPIISQTVAAFTTETAKQD